MKLIGGSHALENALHAMFHEVGFSSCPAKFGVTTFLMGVLYARDNPVTARAIEDYLRDDASNQLFSRASIKQLRSDLVIAMQPGHSEPHLN